MNNLEKKHRSTRAPFECEHCGYTWYGWTGYKSVAPHSTLCTSCGNALENYLWKKYAGNFDEHPQSVHDDALAWIRDKDKKPGRRPATKRFHRSVPKWMRSAIRRGLVKTNGEEVYVVYSREQEAVRVELTDRSSLKPFKI